MNRSALACAGRDALLNPENSVLLLVDRRAFRFSNEIGRGRNGLLGHVARHRFPSSDHLATLDGGSGQNVLHSLRILFEHRYLDRPPAQLKLRARDWTSAARLRARMSWGSGLARAGKYGR